MSDRLRDLLLQAADDELAGMTLDLPTVASGYGTDPPARGGATDAADPSEDPGPAVVPLTARRERRRWWVPVAAAVLAVLVGVGVVLVNRDERVRTVDPLDGGPSVTAPADPDPDTPPPEQVVAQSVEATMARPWGATVTVGSEPVDKLRYQPSDRFRLDQSDGSALVWIGSRQWQVPPEGDAAAMLLTEEGGNAFGVLFGFLGDPLRVAAASGRPGVYLVDIPADACSGDGRAVDPAAETVCTVAVTVTAGRIGVVEVPSPEGADDVLLQIGPPDPAIAVDQPVTAPAGGT